MNKDNFKYSILIFILYLVFNSCLFAQQGEGKFCIDAEPLCGSSQFSYSNTSGFNLAENVPDYGCLVLQLNPSWFYLQIANDGDLQLQIEQSTTAGGFPDLDVDFVAYGPFNSPTSACVSELTAENIVSCSYKLDFVEFVNIPNAKAGEYYLLLITNFSGLSGFITVTQTAGSATTNCNFFNPIITSTIESCQGNQEKLDVTTLNATNYIWYKDDGTNSNIDTKIENENSEALNVTETAIYRAEAYNEDNVLIDTYEFDVSFFITPEVPLNIVNTQCDTYGENDGIGEFDLSIINNEILGDLNTSDYTVSYYRNLDEANNGINVLPNTYINSQPVETIFVRIDNNFPSDVMCFDIGAITLAMQKLPEFELQEEYILCANLNGTEELAVPPEISTRLNINDYSFEWFLNGNLLPEETMNFIIATQEGEYSVKATHRLTSCNEEGATRVELSEPPFVSAEVVTHAFIEDNNIEVTATGIGYGDYSYKIDNGDWQTEATFKDVPLGEHVITVKDLAGCGETSITIFVMDYPLYFTPNGDGINDTWSIAGLQNQTQAKVSIYNRYGKLIKQLNKASVGWDGTLNGTQLPTDDYWFIVHYIEPLNNQPNIFKSHFTLKR